MLILSCLVIAITVTYAPTQPGKSRKPTYNCMSSNPCTPEKYRKGYIYFRNDNPKKWVQCNDKGTCFEVSASPDESADDLVNEANEGLPEWKD